MSLSRTVNGVLYIYVHRQTEVAKRSPALCSEPGAISELEELEAAAAVVGAPGRARPRLPGLATEAFSEHSLWEELYTSPLLSVELIPETKLDALYSHISASIPTHLL